MAVSGFDLEQLGASPYDVAYFSSIQSSANFSGDASTGLTYNGDGWGHLSNLQVGGWDGLLGDGYPDVVSVEFSNIDSEAGTVTIRLLGADGNPIGAPWPAEGLQLQAIGYTGANGSHSAAIIFAMAPGQDPFGADMRFFLTSEPISDKPFFDGSTFVEDATAAGYAPPAPCFAAGTLIRTIDGHVAVESLRVGDMVMTAAGVGRAIMWIGHSCVNVRNHPRAWEVQPVRIRAHAFGDQLPVHDLIVSPGHAVYVDGVLIPAGCLLNGATIVSHHVDTVDYYHVELESHDVLLAEGLPCESYLDDGNRTSFDNAGEHRALHGRLDPQSWEQAYAPCVMAGPQLVEVRQRLLDRAEAMGFRMTEEANLHLVIDGHVVRPTVEAGPRAWFAVPAGAREVQVTSNAGVLAQLVPTLEDGRRLGVCVAEVRLNGEPVAMESDAFGAGFYGCEVQGGMPWRWTNGAGHLVLPVLDAPAMLEMTVVMRMKSWLPAPALALVKAA